MIPIMIYERDCLNAHVSLWIKTICMVSKMKFTRPVIDSHWHVHSWADQSGKDFCTAIDEVQEALNLKAVNICSIPIHQDLGPAQNILAALYKLHNPTAYAHGALVYPQKPFVAPMPDGMDPLSQYQELMEIGFDGIKMLETKPYEQKQYQIHVDDEYFDSFFAACEKESTHMIWHVADPATFWDINKIPERFIARGWFYGDGTYMSYDGMYEQVFNVLDRHPHLNVTFAHFFFWSEKPEKLEDLFSKYEGVSIDITPGAEMYADFRENYEHYRNFFTKHSHRIFFGTDAAFDEAWNPDDSINHIKSVYTFAATAESTQIIVEECQGLDLCDEVKDNLLYKNFLRVAGEVPKAISKPALKRYVEKYKYLITDPKLLRHIDMAVKDF